MRFLVQRVSRARVAVDSRVVGEVGRGILLLAGFGVGDSAEMIPKLCQKVLDLRIFADDEGKMNRSLIETGGGLLVVSQFTLYGDAAKGNRPSFLGAAPTGEAEMLYQKALEYFIDEIGNDRVAAGVFRASMEVELVNDGPVTLLLES